MHNKGSHFIKQLRFGEVSQSPGNYFCWGVIFQNGFSPKAVQPEATGVRGDPKANLEVFCHEVTFQFTVKC